MQEQRERNGGQEHDQEHDHVGVRRSGLEDLAGKNRAEDASKAGGKTEDAGNRATLVLRDLIGDRRDERRQGDVGEELDKTIANEQERDTRRSPHEEQAHHRQQATHEDPRTSASKARGGAVTEGTGEGIGKKRDQDRNTREKTEDRDFAPWSKQANLEGQQQGSDTCVEDIERDGGGCKREHEAAAYLSCRGLQRFWQVRRWFGGQCNVNGLNIFHGKGLLSFQKSS